MSRRVLLPALLIASAGLSAAPSAFAAVSAQTGPCSGRNCVSNPNSAPTPTLTVPGGALPLTGGGGGDTSFPVVPVAGTGLGALGLGLALRRRRR